MISVELEQNMRFLAQNEENATVTLDATPEHGGSGAGFTPMEQLLVALGGCTAMDVISILRKKRQDVTAYRVEVDGTRATAHPQIFTDIKIRHVISGNKVDPEAVRRSIELSETKYCSAFAMLEKAANITSTFEIEEIPAR